MVQWNANKNWMLCKSFGTHVACWRTSLAPGLFYYGAMLMDSHAQCGLTLCHRNKQDFSRVRRHLCGSICFPNTCLYHSAAMVPSWMCNFHVLCAIMLITAQIVLLLRSFPSSKMSLGPEIAGMSLDLGYICLSVFKAVPPEDPGRWVLTESPHPYCLLLQPI